MNVKKNRRHVFHTVCDGFFFFTTHVMKLAKTGSLIRMKRGKEQKHKQT